MGSECLRALLAPIQKTSATRSPNSGTQQACGSPSQGVAEWSKLSEGRLRRWRLTCAYEMYCIEQARCATRRGALRIRRLGVRVFRALRGLDPVWCGNVQRPT